jgi:hypothetical protein
VSRTLGRSVVQVRLVVFRCFVVGIQRFCREERNISRISTCTQLVNLFY